MSRGIISHRLASIFKFIYVVAKNTNFVSYDHTFERFMRHLRRLKFVHGKDY